MVDVTYSSLELDITDTSSQNNFAMNTKINGDAVKETTSSKVGILNSKLNMRLWNSDYLESIF